ncbi:MAG TPA: glycoside hydrolase family 15 protein [Acidobacteriaceae bacterium]|nr:glycoside hydrolase family 15 protein [Terriglobia bacterium]HVC89543.1 glycoside hydrolase family 15 protein [Acidobacteriaceae bacterium]
MAQRPIESCGVIGDLHTVALVAMDGDIDWCCLPQFDSPSVFATLLDEKKGGHFKLAAEEAGTNRQMYMPETNVLLTRFLCAGGVGEVIDFMPVRQQKHRRSESVIHEIVRIARAVRGAMRFRLECAPAFNYARTSHRATLTEGGVLFEAEKDRMVVLGPGEWRIEDGKAIQQFTLQPGETAEFALRYLTGEDGADFKAPVDGDRLMNETLEFWREWLSHCKYEGRWREMVVRSALMLKLLTHHPTGAMVAAPTCSLPEEIGGVRNWDYRYTWIRDTAFTVFSLVRLGFTDEATAFIEWLAKRIHEQAGAQGPLNTMYSIDGEIGLTEYTLENMTGYRNSRPVRVGNAASNQLQLDIYGEMMDAIYLYDKHVSPISYDLWMRIHGVLLWVADNWTQPDDGLWEVRSERQQFVYSKLQCWVALDRGIRLASQRSLPLDRVKLETERDRIFASIMKDGWDPKQQSFTQSYDSKSLDASNLMMPIVMFIAPKDPRMLSTIDKIMEKLVSDSLVHRYELSGELASKDGLTGHEGTFSMCTFWLVDALARADRLDEARFIFEKMLTYGNPLGLYSEEIGSTGSALGNFPQAFTHLGLISAALHLDEKLRR